MIASSNHSINRLCSRCSPKLIRIVLLMLLVSGILQRLPTSACSALENGMRQQNKHPNVVVILTDDQGWGDLSLNGNVNLSTPNIDSLASDGARFDRFYVCPVCSPTRAEFLTGRYHTRGGVYSTSAGGERLNLDEVTIADVFRKAGYRTGAFGKWHNGMQYPYHPNGRGFDEFYGFCSGHWGDYFSPPLERNGQLVKGTGFCVDDFTTQALEFMRESVEAQQPFFAYLPLNTPHSPMQVPDKYWEKFEQAELKLHNREPDKEKLDHVRCALAMCENIDDNVQRILKQLETWEIEEETIVVYFCDNGPNGVRWNGDMKGRKGSTDEGGVRSPCLIRWKSHVPSGQTIEPIGAAIDLLPTLAEMCSVPLTGSTKPLDGKSLASLLLGEKSAENWDDRDIISHWRGKVSVRNQRFRLDNRGGLFDIQADPGQRKNIASQHPQVVSRMSKLATTFREEFADVDQDERRFLLGHADYRFTQLPARDASVVGNIQRSNRFPNCSYLLDWRSKDDRIVFPVEVGCAGTYRVQLQYACKASDVGSKFQLSFKPKNGAETDLVFELTQAHEAPVRGQEHDRVERMESYVKDFATLEIGTIELSEGIGELELRATEIPGDEAMEFRLLFFTRVSD